MYTNRRRPGVLRGARGFTLIELLVVIAIIGILASIVLVFMDGARTKSRDAKRISDLQELSKLLSLNMDKGIVFAGGGVQVAAYIRLNAVNSPANWFTSYSDPSFASTAGNGCKGTASGSPSTAPCQYSITGVNGTYTPLPSTLNYEICAYLENGSANFSGGSASQHLVRIDSNNPSIVAGCN